ncbi:MAG: hypothetical protein A2539_08540 [Elusimicrobia bacterium RIFOXYD2_FULL_34_15]|nr:MAG: hypothetical protein A2539_08540 [Elusimicrobia bacterium RIFOXYD2_FULL_34_15]
MGEFTSIAVDTNNSPHISYYDVTNYDLKYASWTGTNWSIKTVDSTGVVGDYTSIALDTNNRPHISYRAGTNYDLKYASWTGVGWSIKTVDSTGNVGSYTSIALDTNNRPHISYNDATNYDLKYASWTGVGWSIKTVDSTGYVGYYTSIALDTNNRPHISYYDNIYYDLKYASWTGVGWSIKTVDSTGNVGSYTSIALDSNNRPHISYRDETNYDLKYASWTGTDWSIETVNSSGDVGAYTSIALDTNNRPHISYYDNIYYDLKYVKWTNIPILSWTSETNYTDTGIYPAMGLPIGTTFAYRISYSDADNDAPASGYPKLYIKKGGTNIAGSPFTMTAVDPADVTYTDGKLYYSSRTLTSLGTDYAYYFEAYDIWSASATGTPNNSIDAPDVINNYPTLSWTNEVNYISEGVYPVIGLPNNTTFAYRISYSDSDNDAPYSGYPRLYIKKGGTNIAGSPFTMTAVDPADVTYTDGKLYYSSRTLTSPATDYVYYFEAYDVWSASATGTPSNLIDAPDVVNDITPPSAPSVVRDGTSTDILQTDYTTQISANWDTCTDAESGIAKYWYAIGTTAGGTELTGGWVNNSTATTVTKTSLTLATGTTYYFTVKAENGDGVQGSVTNSNGQLVQPTPPNGVPTVPVDTGIYSTNSSIIFSWTPGTSADPESDIIGYWLRVSTTLNGNDKFDADVGNVLTSTIIDCLDGKIYYAKVRAKNGAGLYSEWSDSSDGIIIDLSLPVTPTDVSVSAGLISNVVSVSGTTEAGSSIYSILIKDQKGDILTTGIDVSGITIDATGNLTGSIQLGDIDKNYPLVTGITVEIKVKDDAGNVSTSGISSIYKITSTSNELYIKLYNNLFNPTKNEKMYIRYELPETRAVIITINDFSGREIKNIVDNQLITAGAYIAEWDGKNLASEVVASGPYIVYIQAGNYKAKKKVLVIK